MQRALAAVQHRLGDESGMTTAEYAVGTIATCGMGGLLFKLLTSDTVLSLLTNLFRSAVEPFL